MTDFPDSINYEFDDLDDAVVGSPTKASELNAVIENVKLSLERNVVGYAQQGGPNDNVTIDPSGFAMIEVYRVCEEGQGELLLDPLALPFDADEADQMTLFGRRIDVSFFGAAANTEERAATMLPGGEHDTSLSPGSSVDPGYMPTVDRLTELSTLSFWSGPGQAAWNSEECCASITLSNPFYNQTRGPFDVTVYAWVQTNTGCLYLRFVVAAGGQNFFVATAARITLGPVTGVYSS